MPSKPKDVAAVAPENPREVVYQEAGPGIAPEAEFDDDDGRPQMREEDVQRLLEAMSKLLIDLRSTGRRDAFAAAALQTLVSRSATPDEAADSAWRYADAMISHPRAGTAADAF